MKTTIALALAGALFASTAAQALDTAKTMPTIKTRLDHLSGTSEILAISYLNSEITSITCEKWTMMGIKSWNDQNNFTMPAGPSVALLNINKFDGYCKTAGSIVAHTDDGDFPGMLDRGDGNWSDSTKLIFGR